MGILTTRSLNPLNLRTPRSLETQALKPQSPKLKALKHCHATIEKLENPKTLAALPRFKPSTHT